MSCSTYYILSTFKKHIFSSSKQFRKTEFDAPIGWSTVTYEGARPSCCYGNMGMNITTGRFVVPIKGKWRFDFQGMSSVSQYISKLISTSML